MCLSTIPANPDAIKPIPLLVRSASAYIEVFLADLAPHRDGNPARILHSEAG